MNLLNEEIRCLRQTIVEKRKIMNSVKNTNMEANLKIEIMVLEKILTDKLCELLNLEEGLL